MKEHIIIKIPGEPKAQKRHRHTSAGKFVRVYDPSASDKGDFLSQVKKAAPWDPIMGPIEIVITFAFSRPKSHYGTGKNLNVMKPNVPHWHISKPDIDNNFKFITDSMSKIFWHDDSQICKAKSEKIYTSSPYIEIEIIEL